MFYLQMNALLHSIQIIVMSSLSRHKLKLLSKCCVFEVCQYTISMGFSILHFKGSQVDFFDNCV